MNKVDVIQNYLAVAKATGKTTLCVRCKKLMVYSGRQPAPAEHAVCATCVKAEA